MAVPETSPALEASSAFRMVDIGEKSVTFRRAVATGQIVVGEIAFQRIAEKSVTKGDVLALAEVAGIQAAKRTADWLPLCHPLLIDRARLTLTLGADKKSIEARAEISGTGKTGFEMEAMTATSAALLCVYDLVKAIEPAMTISRVQLIEKEGGKSGHWRPDTPATAVAPQQALLGISAAVLTVSDRVSQGLASDGSGPVLKEFLQARGAQPGGEACVSDDQNAIAEKLREWAAQGVRLILTTGGTGLSPRDVTPEAVQTVCDRLIPGIGERLRAEGSRHTELAPLSRSLGGLIGSTLVIALPGSVKAVREGCAALEKILPHALHIAGGGNHEK